jgi:general secretion pathway protein K
MSEQSPAQERGVILVIVLWTVAMMTVVIAALSTNVRTSANLAGTETRRLKTEMLLEGGIDVAAGTIIASGDQVQRLADGHASQIDLGNGNLAQMKIIDAGGFVDINRADDALLGNIIGRVTGSAETGKAVAGQITQWRSSTVESAEDSEPSAFISTAQLYNVKGIDRKVVASLLPFVSLYSKEGRINLTAAPEQVIASIPDINPVELETLLNARSQRNWEGKDVKDILDTLGDYVSLDPTNVYIVDLELISSADLIPGSHLRATVLIDSAATVPFHVLSRSW